MSESTYVTSEEEYRNRYTGDEEVNGCHLKQREGLDNVACNVADVTTISPV